MCIWNFVPRAILPTTAAPIGPGGLPRLDKGVVFGDRTAATMPSAADLIDPLCDVTKCALFVHDLDLPVPSDDSTGVRSMDIAVAGLQVFQNHARSHRTVFVV